MCTATCFPPQLVEAALRRGEAELAARGSLVAETGKRTGRSPKDKFIVKDSITDNKVDWGRSTCRFRPDKFDALYERVLEYLKGKELFVQDLFCGADPHTGCPSRSSTNLPGTTCSSGNSLFAPPRRS